MPTPATIWLNTAKEPRASAALTELLPPPPAAAGPGSAAATSVTARTIATSIFMCPPPRSRAYTRGPPLSNLPASGHPDGAWARIGAMSAQDLRSFVAAYARAKPGEVVHVSDPVSIEHDVMALVLEYE